MKAMTESVRNYLAKCPALCDRAKVWSINFLGSSALSYTVEDVPGEPIRKRYIDGSAVRERSFVLASREVYTKDAVTQARNIKIYDMVCAWIEEQNRAGVFPEIPNGIPEAVEVSSSGYVMQQDGNTARYQIQIKIIYNTEA